MVNAVKSGDRIVGKIQSRKGKSGKVVDVLKGQTHVAYLVKWEGGEESVEEADSIGTITVAPNKANNNSVEKSSNQNNLSIHESEHESTGEE